MATRSTVEVHIINIGQRASTPYYHAHGEKILINLCDWQNDGELEIGDFAACVMA